MPDKDKKMNEDYFEFLLKSSLEEIAEEQGKKYEKELESIEQPEYSKGFHNKMKHILRNKSALDKKYAAAVLAFVLVSSSALVYSVDADKFKFISTFFTENKDNIDISTDENMIDYNIDSLPEGWDYIYLPKYMIRGFKVSDIKSTSSVFNILYVRGNKKISFKQINKADTNISIDNERNEVKQVKVNERDAYLIQENDENVLIWNNSDYTFNLSGSISGEEILDIADSLYIFSK